MAKNEFKTICLVDDDTRICEEMSEFLINAGYKTFYFTNPNACLSSIINKKCNLLIIDYKLPEMDGITLMKEVKRILPFLPIIILTGYGNIQLAVSAMHKGADDFLEKPIDTELLLTKIKKILQNDGEINKVYNSLTNMENKVLNLILSGKNNKEISNLLYRSKRTIENHRAHIMKKLNVHNAITLARNAHSHQIYKKDNKIW